MTIRNWLATDRWWFAMLPSVLRVKYLELYPKHSRFLPSPFDYKEV